MNKKQNFHLSSNIVGHLVSHPLVTFRLSIFCLIIGLNVACNNSFFERGTQIEIVNKDVPPELKLRGTGSVLRLFFYGPYKSLSIEEIKAKLTDPPIWEISPPPNTVASNLPTIRYGVLPNQFTQNTPAIGSLPQLEEGKCYRVVAVANGANGGSVSFCINNGRVAIHTGP